MESLGHSINDPSVALVLCQLAPWDRMAKAFFIFFMSEALVAADALYVIMRHTLPTTFAKHQPARFSLLRPEAKTMETGGISLVCAM
jgi:hypothetical protein